MPTDNGSNDDEIVPPLSAQGEGPWFTTSPAAISPLFPTKSHQQTVVSV
ncbi:hypothetical protein KCP73_14580 [Salmonella enterica subsp. enterica]|nr:hypothetical protein KCP73_14580 [Salmonella enterica subsp. enterica]